MKFIIIVFVFISFAVSSFSQCPYNDNVPAKDDLNWQLVWGDSFNYVGKPDPLRWRESQYGAGYDSIVIETSNGHNTYCYDSLLRITGKRGSYTRDFDSTHVWTIIGYDPATHLIDAHDTDSTVHYKITRPYTKGSLGSRIWYGYGYYEAKIRLPDSYNTSLFGNDYNNAIWMFNASNSQNIAWSELDYEITSYTGDHGPNINNMEICMHMEKPANAANAWKALHPGNVFGDPAHFYNERIDQSYMFSAYYAKYQNYGFTFSHGWHIVAWEWLPDQIKFYVDNKLYFRLEGSYRYDYTDIYGFPQTIYPVHDLSDTMPINLQLDYHPAHWSDTLVSNSDSFSMDVKYVKYYQLKKAACASAGFFQPGVPPYELCGHYIQQVYTSVVLGDSTGGSPRKSVTVSRCRESVRAKTIKLFDGFFVGEGEFYACDVDPCKLP